MKTLVQSQYQLHVCDADERANVDAFDVYFRWRVPAYDGQWREELLLKASGWLTGDFEDDDDPVMNCEFPIRYRMGARKKLLLGPERRRLEVGSVSSGGNMLWEVIRLHNHSAAHVLNCLRNHPRWDVEEWDEAFRERVWESRRALDERAMREFGRKFVGSWLKGLAKDEGCAVDELLAEKCPQCRVNRLERMHHAGTFGLPECWVKSCAECGWQGEPA